MLTQEKLDSKLKWIPTEELTRVKDGTNRTYVDYWWVSRRINHKPHVAFFCMAGKTPQCHKSEDAGKRLYASQIESGEFWVEKIPAAFVPVDSISIVDAWFDHHAISNDMLVVAD